MKQNFQNPNAIINSSSWIYLTVTNSFGCSATDSAFIRAVELECSERNLYAPNAFSPNGDHVNDKFFLIAHNVELEEFQIYNRWGEKEYEWNTTNGGWDGRSASGVRAAAGTYYYIINAASVNGEKYFEKGTFSLILGK